MARGGDRGCGLRRAPAAGTGPDLLTRTSRLLPWVAAGGAAGALARYALTQAAPQLVTILAINVVGSFLLALLVSRRRDDPWARAVLGTGVLGGFTTWSALAVQVVDASPGVALAYLGLTVGLGTAAARWGLR